MMPTRTPLDLGLSIRALDDGTASFRIASPDTSAPFTARRSPAVSLIEVTPREEFITNNLQVRCHMHDHPLVPECASLLTSIRWLRMQLAAKVREWNALTVAQLYQKQVRRKDIITELFTTERQYVTDLGTVINVRTA